MLHSEHRRRMTLGLYRGIEGPEQRLMDPERPSH